MDSGQEDLEVNRIILPTFMKNLSTYLCKFSQVLAIINIASTKLQCAFQLTSVAHPSLLPQASRRLSLP